MEGSWKILAYVLLVGFLPAAFWYAMWPYRRRLNIKEDNNQLRDNELVSEEIVTGER